MGDLTMLREFNEISEDFLSGAFDLTTVAKLIVSVRSNRYKLSPQQIKKLLEIPISVLENDVEINRKSNFMSSGDYFSGNIYSGEDEYLERLKNRFTSRVHDLEDIIELTKYVQANLESIGEIEFILRISEVTIREDVNLLDSSNFAKSGRVFSKIILDAIQLA